MVFYHFTNKENLSRILVNGFLRPSESNVGSVIPSVNFPHGEHAGPDVVWLTDTPDPGMGHGLMAHRTGKNQVRITVDVKAIRWLDWEHTSYMDPSWRQAFVGSGGGDEATEHWYLVPAPIRGSRFREIALRQPDGSYKALEIKT